MIDISIYIFGARLRINVRVAVTFVVDHHGNTGIILWNIGCVLALNAIAFRCICCLYDWHLAVYVVSFGYGSHSNIFLLTPSTHAFWSVALLVSIYI